MKNILLFLLKIILKNSVLKMLILTYIMILLNFEIKFSLFISVVILSYIDIHYNFKIENFSSDDKNSIAKINISLDQKSSTDTDIKNTDIKNTDIKNTDIKNTDIKNTDIKITDSKITDSKITDSKITDSKITDSKITDSKITDSKITDSKITDSKITDSKITDSQNSNIQDLSILSSQNILNSDKEDTNKASSSNSALMSNGIVIDKTIQSIGISAVNSILGLVDNNNNIDKNDDTDEVGISKDLNKDSIKDNELKESKSKLDCVPVIPQLLFTESTNKNYIVRISINSSQINPSGKCIINDRPLEYNLFLGTYKPIKPKSKDNFYEIPGNIIRINKEQKNEKKDINIFVRKGYKITFISNLGNETFVGLANIKDTPFVNSMKIKKGLLNIAQIKIEKNKLYKSKI